MLLISDQYFHLQIFDDHLLDYQRYDIWNIKYNKGEINQINDLNNSNNYEIIINKYLISSKYYFILSVTNNINTENKLYLKYNFIEEEGNIIYDNINTYFTIYYLHKFTFPIFNESNSKIILQLFTESESSIIVNEKNNTFQKNQIEIIDNSQKVEITSNNEKNEVFSIRSKIPEKKIRLLDFSFENYTIPTTEKEIFIVQKINKQDFEDSQIIMHVIEVNITNDINYYFEFGYYNLNEISSFETKKAFDENFVMIDLESLKKYNIGCRDKSFYLFYYFSNIKSETDLIISTFPFLKKIKIEENKYNNKLEKNNILFQILLFFIDNVK